jgi:hypothetical protein
VGEYKLIYDDDLSWIYIGIHAFEMLLAFLYIIIRRHMQI